jgi:hypothetical protein
MKSIISFFVIVFTGTNCLSQSFASLAVFVSENQSGTPVPSASVIIKEAGWASKTTGSDGKAFFEKSMPVGEIHYIVSKEGYQGVEGTFNITTEEKSNTLRIIFSKFRYESDTIKIDSIKPHSSSRKISQEGKNNLYIEGDNKGDIRVGDTYQKPPQRHVTTEDLERICKYAPDKNKKIKVVSNGSIESNTFRDEILQILSLNGYNILTQSVVGQSLNYFRQERLTITDGRYGNETWIEIIVNPQE